MADVEQTVDEIERAKDWDSRVTLIRKVPEQFGTAQHAEVYARIAERIYVPRLAPNFAYVHWRDEYRLDAISAAYDAAHELTQGFTDVGADSLAKAIRSEPRTLRVFRLILGLTAQEFAGAAKIAAERLGIAAIGHSGVKNLEAGGTCPEPVARCCAETIDLVMRGELFPPPRGDLTSKLDKPDTAAGWDSVRTYAREGVPLPVLLHQRHYGGAFRQLLDATSTRRGDIIEDAVEALFTENGVSYVRTGSSNQEEIARRFGITVRPAPDFVIFDRNDTLRAVLECKGANDGGTARDKAARFRSLRQESMRVGGVPLFAVLEGLGWTRAADALGPVIRDTDGRTFLIPTLTDMLTVDPFPQLVS